MLFIHSDCKPPYIFKNVRANNSLYQHRQSIWANEGISDACISDLFSKQQLRDHYASNKNHLQIISWKVLEKSGLWIQASECYSGTIILHQLVLWFCKGTSLGLWAMCGAFMICTVTYWPNVTVNVFYRVSWLWPSCDSHIHCVCK